MSLGGIVVVIVLLSVAPVIASCVVEALRPVPAEPKVLRWAKDLSIRYTDIAGIRIRYVTTGRGPALVLLHTLRTQLDIFQKVIADLSQHFTVYALDYPGHGYSDIPAGEYDANRFVSTVAGFLDKLDIEQAVLTGVSIGGSTALLLAARGNTRVKRVIAINPYDYAGGRGMARSSPVARLIFIASRIPIVGPTVMRLRNRLVERKIFEGGVAEPSALPTDLAEEMFRVGTRKGHYRAFLNLLRHASEWEQARAEYPRIGIPVLLVYGERDWSTTEERETTRTLIPGARMETVAGGGHFLPLDRPREVVRAVLDFG